MNSHVRIRNGMRKDPTTGDGGATEGDIRGSSTDIIEQTGGVVDKVGGHLLIEQISPTSVMKVLVNPGVAYIPNDSFNEFDSDSVKFWEAVFNDDDNAATLDIDSNSSGSNRIDLICAKMDIGTFPNYQASNIATLIVVKGTPGAGVPSTPAYHEAFARITVANGATSIVTGNIADVRRQIKFRTELLPEDAGSISLVDTNGESVVLTDPDTSPVNQVTVKNADAGEAPSIKATGSDTNIDLQLDAKGDAFVKIKVLQQDSTTDSYKANTVVLTGWTKKTGDLTLSMSGNAVAYGITFDSLPIVVACYAGGKASPATDISATGPQGWISMELSAMSETGFTPYYTRNRKSDNTTSGVFSNTVDYITTWIAIGVLT